MTNEYHDNIEDDSSSFWNKDPPPVYLSGVSRFRRWLFPALTAAAVLVLIITVGVTNMKTSKRLSSAEKSVSNLTDGLRILQELSSDTMKDVHRMKFAVESNREQLSSVSEALKQLASLDTISRTVTSLKCSIERIINNSSAGSSCCPLGWDQFRSSCFLFSKSSLSWHEARDWCSSHESHLLILNSDEEWNFVIQLASGTFFWIGLSDERTGKWEWVNQTPYVMNRRRWKPGQPDSWTHHGLGPGDEDCAHLHHDGRLNDLHCSTRLRYICQRHG